MEKWLIDSFSGEYAWLNNFYPCSLEYNERILKLLKLDFKPGLFKFPENAYQAAKTKKFDLFEQIRLTHMPGKAKRLGKQIQKEKINFRKDWYSLNLLLMEELSRIKYNISFFKHKLLETGYAFLREGNNWHDNFFGDCICSDCKNILGKNHLGKIIMKIREELR